VTICQCFVSIGKAGPNDCLFAVTQPCIFRVGRYIGKQIFSSFSVLYKFLGQNQRKTKNANKIFGVP
jgi:hypothetical protein